MTQNYRRLGLVSKLSKFTGGTEKSVSDPTAVERTSLAASGGLLKLPSAGESVLTEVKVERDASGKIVRVVDSRKENPLNDPLAHLDSDSEMEEEKEHDDEWEGIEEDHDDRRSEVVKALEREAMMPVVKKVRHQSEQEREWVRRLVERYGEDVDGMVRDRKLNPMQQTGADIRKRIRKWKAGGG